MTMFENKNIGIANDSTNVMLPISEILLKHLNVAPKFNAAANKAESSRQWYNILLYHSTYLVNLKQSWNWLHLGPFLTKKFHDLQFLLWRPVIRLVQVVLTPENEILSSARIHGMLLWIWKTLKVGWKWKWLNGVGESKVDTSPVFVTPLAIGL